MNSMHSLLLEACNKGLLRQLDLQFALCLAADNPALMLAAAWVSAEAGAGHACLPVAQMTPGSLLAGRDSLLAQQIWLAAGEPVTWQSIFAASPVVGSGVPATPLVLCQQRLYLHRMWRAEKSCAEFLSQKNTPVVIAPQAVRTVLDNHFNKHDDWQKIAAAVALTRRIAVISGGPGTGKTTTIARLLAALIQLAEKPLRIQLAAPTGKAAARLTESMGRARQGLSLLPAEKAYFPSEAVTLHRLLGAQPDSQRLRHHTANPLHLDVLVIDEASMIDLPMMAKMIDALPPGARVILLGDRDQLASVEAGAVLGDICRCAVWGYSQQRAAELITLTGCKLTGQDNAPHNLAVRDSICLLRRSYRFDASSGIGQLAQAVNQGDCHLAERLLQQGLSDIIQRPLTSPYAWQHMLNDVVAGYTLYLKEIAAGAPVKRVLECFSHYQLLCALREGPFGLAGLNERIARALERSGLICRPARSGNWYIGRPIMITRNDSVLGLFNGDIGIVMPENGGALKVWFLLPDGNVKAVLPGRIPSHETAWAMTVHKSQGSEFDHTALVLPEQHLPVLTRELIYTAVTRARKQLTLYADNKVLNAAIGEQTQRRSGLIEQLMDYQAPA